MPLRCPAGALPEAYRLICLRSLRCFARGLFRVDYSFGSEGSKKCNYCTQQKEKCSPVPEYVKEEFAAFVAAMDLLAAADASDEPEEHRPLARRMVEDAALVLVRRVQVTRSQEKELSVVGLLAASHQVLVEIRDGLRRLEGRVAAMESVVLASGKGPVPRPGGAAEEEEEEESMVSWSESDRRSLGPGSAEGSESEV
ncbi:hypothetical protein COCVIDRAFT_32164 [Bipolaris victoriae FI3]|uniref:Uncharacterized protein n=1 Tax=Bipolaris victoriae (strain FI3) TaxID=930091 RepID=W7DZP0_BIPV3|nr:hypothetical protein COCVIDRAFT_32164 [Bipolaris victoriae FI3]